MLRCGFNEVARQLNFAEHFFRRAPLEGCFWYFSDETVKEVKQQILDIENQLRLLEPVKNI